MKHIVIGIPCVDKPHMLFMQSMLRVFYEHGKVRLPTAIITASSSIICNARDNIIKGMLDIERAGTEVSHLFMIDSDMIVPPYVLLKLLSHQKDIVACTYVRRSSPFDVLGKTLSHEREEYHNGLIEMSAVPTGCLLINRRVLSHFKPPYWRLHHDEEHGITRGEDYFFCERVRELGYKIHLDVDLSKEIGHVSEKVLYPEQDGWSGSIDNQTPGLSAA